MLTLYQIISLVITLVGIPSLATIVGMIRTKQKKIEEQQRKIEEKKDEEIQALKRGVQALLRSQMINDYNKWEERGYAPIYAREGFENCWTWYEILGENGVMQGVHDMFMALPTSPSND